MKSAISILLNHYLNNNRSKLIIFFIIFLIVSFFSYFYMLTSFPVQLWDEGMFAVQGFEMAENNNWLIQYFNGTPDHLNNKPPFAVWCIALSFKIFGINELALRLPSALFGFFTSLVLFYFIWRYTGNILSGFITALILNTSLGFIGLHICKTGEADAILTFFVTLSLLSFLLFSETDKVKKKRTYLMIFTICLSLAALTKSIVALLILPGILLYLIIKGKLWSILRSRDIYFSILFFLIVNAIYYLLREYYDPGNFRLVLERDFYTRYFEHLGHQFPFSMYIENLINKRYFPWIYFVPVGTAVLLFVDRFKNIGLYFGLNFISFLLIISFSGTKLYWYDEFLYPMGAIIIGLTVGHIFDKSQLSPVQKIVCCLLIFTFPFNTVISYSYSLQNLSLEDETRYNGILSFIKKEKPSIEKLNVLYKAHPSHLLFYKKVLEDPRFKFDITDNVNQFLPGEIVVVCDKSQMKSLDAHYNYEILYVINGCFAYKIKYKRSDYLERKYLNTKKEVTGNELWIFNIRQKAATNQVSLDHQLTRDIIYIMQENKEISQVEADSLLKMFLKD